MIATDKGEWHLLSSSGYYVSSLFQGDPMKIKWPGEAIPGADMSMAPPGMGGEDFGGSIIRANDGALYVQAGKTAFINCKVSGLDTIKVLASGSLQISPADMLTAQQFMIKYLRVSDSKKIAAVKKKSVVFTGRPNEDFAAQPIAFGSDFARIQAWLAHDAEFLYAAWQVDDNTPWINGATGFENMYARGDTVDLQLGANPRADKNRSEAVGGDLRLSIGQLQGKNTAVLYRRVSDRKAPRDFYSGTSRGGYTMEFVKKLDDVKIEGKPIGDRQYFVEVAIPLRELDVRLEPGLKLRGDLGVTYGDPAGKRTNLRVYWSNKATGIVADEVEELRMQPSLWGEFDFE